MAALNDSVLIALPTLDEEGAIEQIISGIRACTELPIMIIDGYSTDATVHIARGLGVDVLTRDAGIGYGCAIQKALEVAEERKFEWLLIMDCDMTYRPGDIQRLISCSRGQDLIVGVRPMNRITPSHRLANWLHSKLASVLFRQPVADINSGLRMFRVDRFKNRLTEKNMGMVAQISCIAMRNKWCVKEVFIGYDKRIGQSKIDVLDWFVISWCILRERFNSVAE